MDAQAIIIKARNYNPRLIGGGDSIEFSFDYESAAGLDDARENIREFVTIGNKRKKQAEDDKYRFTVVWFEPTNNIPERIYTMRENSGDRTVTFSYVHSIEVIGRSDLDVDSGGLLTVYIAGFRYRRAGFSDGAQMYRCSITLQEV